MSTTTTTGTLTAGSSKTFNLAPGSALSLTLSPNVRVTITETPETVSGSGVGGNTTRVHEPQLAGTFAYGPYAMGGVVVVAVASYSGSSVAWTRKDTVVTTSSDGTSLVSGDGNFPVRELRTNMARNRIVKRGSDLINTTISTGWTRSGAGTVYRASSLYSRRSSHTMEVDMTSASADATLEWSNATGVAADPTDQLLSLDVYIPEVVSANVGGTVSMNIFVSNATTYAAPGTLWTVNSNYLLQGADRLLGLLRHLGLHLLLHRPRHPVELGEQGLRLFGAQAQLVRGSLEPLDHGRVATIGCLEPVLVGVSGSAQLGVEGVELLRRGVLGRQLEQVLGATGKLLQVAVGHQHIRGLLPTLVAHVGVRVLVERSGPDRVGTRLRGGGDTSGRSSRGAVIAQQGGSRLVRHSGLPR